MSHVRKPPDRTCPFSVLPGLRYDPTFGVLNTNEARWDYHQSAIFALKIPGTSWNRDHPSIATLICDESARDFYGTAVASTYARCLKRGDGTGGSKVFVMGHSR